MVGNGSDGGKQQERQQLQPDIFVVVSWASRSSWSLV